LINNIQTSMYWKKCQKLFNYYLYTFQTILFYKNKKLF